MPGDFQSKVRQTLAPKLLALGSPPPHLESSRQRPRGEATGRVLRDPRPRPAPAAPGDAPSTAPGPPASEPPWQRPPCVDTALGSRRRVGRKPGTPSPCRTVCLSSAYRDFLRENPEHLVEVTSGHQPDAVPTVSGALVQAGACGKDRSRPHVTPSRKPGGCTRESPFLRRPRVFPAFTVFRWGGQICSRGSHSVYKRRLSPFLPPDFLGESRHAWQQQAAVSEESCFAAKLGVCGGFLFSRSRRATTV
ncbi:uncharacterized protein LOC123932265 [Meles meles]|uniref:uncharacterized protein LOC123932265 n=1 Tax=Meles meles TaxID=9662 RepID=UPI001E69A0AC|nr:uncharacterized protein LOC123932265 [Meles meles]